MCECWVLSYLRGNKVFSSLFCFILALFTFKRQKMYVFGCMYMYWTVLNGITCVCAHVHCHFYKQLGMTQTPQDSLCCLMIICIMFYFRETVNVNVKWHELEKLRSDLCKVLLLLLHRRTQVIFSLSINFESFNVK